MTTKETKTEKSNFWERFRKIGLTILIVVSLLFSFSNHYDLESFKDAVGPIGTNPLQLNPTKFISAEVGSENMHPGSPSTDSIVGHNNTTKMLTMLNKNDLGFATSASLSNYVTNSSLTTTLGSYTTTSALTSTLANYALTASLSSYVPTSRTLTINGVALNLSADRSWTIPVNSYTAGTGLSLVGTTFNNTAPDQIVSFTGNNGLVWSGTYPNFSITQKRQETYSGTTNASGVYTVTFGTAYAVAPNIQANIINGADNQNLRITSVSTTGFTVLARTRVDVAGLLPTWNNATGLGIDVLITEK